MIVCLCRGLSDTALRRFIDAGASTPGQLARICGVGMDCGACCPAVKELLREPPGRVMESADAGSTEGGR
jgi:bacterioferritin-associated ferredoxin